MPIDRELPASRHTVSLLHFGAGEKTRCAIQVAARTRCAGRAEPTARALLHASFLQEENGPDSSRQVTDVQAVGGPTDDVLAHMNFFKRRVRIYSVGVTHPLVD